MKETEKITFRVRRAHLVRMWSERLAFAMNLESGFLCVCALVYFPLDYLTDFPWYARIFATLALTAFFMVYLPFKRRSGRYFSDVRAASELEGLAEREKRPFESVLVSGVEFASGASSSGSAELRRSVVELASTERYSPFTLELVERKRVLRASALLSCVLAGLALWLVADSDSFTVFFRRAAGLDARYRTLSSITKVEYPVFTERFVSVPVSVHVSGVLPSRARAFVAFEGAKEFEVAANPDRTLNGVYSFEVAEPMKDFSFYIKAGDAVSPPYKVKVIAPPALSGGETRVTPPAYTHRKSYTLPAGPLEAPEGSSIELVLDATSRLSSCGIVFSDGRRQTGVDTGSGTRFKFKPFVLGKTGGCSFELVDEYGIPNRVKVDYTFFAIPDKEPVLTLLRPSTGAFFAPVSRISCRFEASDDYGIKSVRCYWLVKRRIDRGVSTEPEIRKMGNGVLEIVADGRDESELSFSGVIDHSVFKMIPGDTVLLTFEVNDFYPGKRVHGDADAVSVPSSCDIELHMVTADELRTMLSDEEMQAHNLLLDITEDMKTRKTMLEKLLQKGSSK